MPLPRLWMLVVLFLFATGCRPSSQPSQPAPDPLLLVSFDGFRHDYMELYDTPNLDTLAAEGIRAEALVPVFPTKTFPNHYSIVTGLYPENSGFVSNTMYDPEWDATYRISDREAVEDARWYQGEPIWNTAEKQGLRAGTMFWVGSEAPIQDMRPTHYKLFDGNMPYKARIDTVIAWLAGRQEEPVDFATLYFSLTDTYGHRFAPRHDSTAWAVRRLDQMAGYLKKRARAAGLWERLNLMIVSDHGMTALDAQKIIVLDELINMDDVRMVDWSPIAFIQPKAGRLDEVYKALKQHAGHYRVYKKQELPERWHLKNHRRVTDLVMVADAGWTITTRDRVERFKKSLPRGTHGFDNSHPDMHGFWVARGPAFKKDYQIGKVSIVHLYPLMAELLGLNAAPNDGVLDSVRSVLK